MIDELSNYSQRKCICGEDKVEVLPNRWHCGNCWDQFATDMQEKYAPEMQCPWNPPTMYNEPPYTKEPE